MLKISKQYLREVLSEKNYKKLNFVSIEEFNSDDEFDVALQIDGFNEMDREVVMRYIDFISTNCRFFYTKNPVAKYFDPELDNNWKSQNTVSLALTSGIITDIINVHDNDAVRCKSDNFIKMFVPDNNWKCIYSSFAPPITFMWESIYVKLDQNLL